MKFATTKAVAVTATGTTITATAAAANYLSMKQASDPSQQITRSRTCRFRRRQPAHQPPQQPKKTSTSQTLVLQRQFLLTRFRHPVLLQQIEKRVALTCAATTKTATAFAVTDCQLSRRFHNQRCYHAIVVHRLIMRNVTKQRLPQPPQHPNNGSLSLLPPQPRKPPQCNRPPPLLLSQIC